MDLLKNRTVNRRVVVTGLGVISCVGNDVKSFWNSLKEGVCGIDTIYPDSNLPVNIGGTVKDFHPEDYGIDKPFLRKQDIFSVYAMAAANQAMEDSGLQAAEEGGDIDPQRLGVYVGSGIGGFTTISREVERMKDDPTGQWISPLFVPTMISNIAGGLIAIRHHAEGPCVNIVTACSTSTNSLGEAYRAIKFGFADAIISGGTDHSTLPIGIAGFANAKALTRETNPKHACLPFNADRAGFVMADGAAVLVLEEYEHAVARGAKIYAEMVGYGCTCDAHHFTAPRPDGVTQSRCIKQALDEAGFDENKDNLYINAHGTGTKLNDVTETKAFKLALGDFAYKAHISSTKSMHGHMFGATGAAEAIATVLALKNGLIPPTINLDNPDPECDLDYTPNVAREEALTLGISDSFGFGGHNACIAFRKY